MLKRIFLLLIFLFQTLPLEASLELHAFTYSNKSDPALTRLFESAAKFDVPLEVIGIPYIGYEGVFRPFNGLIDKLIYLDEHLNNSSIPDDDIILFLDGFDTLFLEGPELIIERFLEFNSPVVVGVERYCHPDRDQTSRYPPSPTTHRFINSGFFIGYSRAIKDFVRSALQVKLPARAYKGRKAKNDQLFVTLHYLKSLEEGHTPIQLDYKSRLVFNANRRDYPPESLEFSSKPLRLIVKETNESPCIFHGPGRNLPSLELVYKTLIKGF